jgi:hypothetical protein
MEHVCVGVLYVFERSGCSLVAYLDGILVHMFSRELQIDIVQVMKSQAQVFFYYTRDYIM